MEGECANQIHRASATTGPGGSEFGTANRPAPQPCLTEVELFQDVPAQQMEAMSRMLPLRKVAAGEVIYDPYRAETVLFIVKSGRVRIFTLSATGKALTISILAPGTVFGQMELVGQSMGRNYAEAMEPSVICQLTMGQVEKFFLSDHRIAVRVSQILGRRVSELETRLADLALRALPQRLASVLLQLASPGAWPRRSAVVALTHEQIASVAGATREAVSKVLSNFAQEGLISQGRRRITILDAEALEELKDAPENP